MAMHTYSIISSSGSPHARCRRVRPRAGAPHGAPQRLRLLQPGLHRLPYTRLGPEGELRHDRAGRLAVLRPARQPAAAARLQHRCRRHAARHHQQPAPALHRRGVHLHRRRVPAALGRRGRRGGTPPEGRRHRLRAHLDLPRLHQHGAGRRLAVHRARHGPHRRHHLGPLGPARGGTARPLPQRRQPARRHRRRGRPPAGVRAGHADGAGAHRPAAPLQRRGDEAPGRRGRRAGVVGPTLPRQRPCPAAVRA
ncbi:hypothetical protein RKD37_000373 [Streptomyces ambofaciens]